MLKPANKAIAAASAVLLLAAVPSAFAAPVSYFSASGVGSMGSPEGDWGNFTLSSVAFEVTIDFTTTVDDESRPIVLWEAGGSGKGAGLVLDGDDLHFFAGSSNADVATASHGLTATLNDVQIVAVYEIGAGTAGNELLTLYVNGAQVGQADLETGNDWAGGDEAGLGSKFNTQRWNATTLFATANVQNYPETDISFAVYRLASSGGPADNTVENILVPEPSSLALMGLGGLLIARRRRS